MDVLSEVTQYGFRWGPFVVERLAYVEGRGRTLEVRTDSGQYVQLGISEKGQRISVHGPNRRGRPHRASDR